MNLGRSTLWRRAGDTGVVVVCPLVAAAALVGGALPTVAVIGALAATVGIYVGLRHPLWLYWALAVALGALPFGYFPGVHLPLTFGLGFAVVLAALIHPTARPALGPLQTAVLLLVLTSALSVVVTGRTSTDYVEFVKWSVSTLMVLVLCGLSREHLARFGRIYVYASAAAASGALVILVADPEGRLIRYLRIVGYGREEEATRYVYSAAGKTVRLAGTYIDPNTAGIGLLVALVVCVVLLEGWRRTLLVALFVIAILLTLSRAATFSVLGGVIFVLLFHGMQVRHRQIVIGAIGVAVVAALATPQVRSRVFSSFGSEDVGSSAREDALANYPRQMSGHWAFGLGWGREEFKNGAEGFTLNHVANAPLLTVYRGGILAGLLFVAVLVIGCLMAYRALRSTSLPAAMLGGVFVCFCVVALQLDFPTVTIPSVTMMFSVFLVFLVYVDQTPDVRSTAEPADARDVPIRAY
jgi:polysaccharide biosynthesis protein PslJ